MKKPAGLSVGAIGFAILVIALDFAVVRAACLSPTPQERATREPPYCQACWPVASSAVDPTDGRSSPSSCSR